MNNKMWRYKARLYKVLKYVKDIILFTWILDNNIIVRKDWTKYEIEIKLKDIPKSLDCFNEDNL